MEVCGIVLDSEIMLLIVVVVVIFDDGIIVVFDENGVFVFFGVFEGKYDFIFWGMEDYVV